MSTPLDLSEELSQLASNLDISDELYEKAIVEYDRVAEWLSEESSPLRDYEPSIYPQGSFRLGTMILPYQKSDEFDIDLVCRLSIRKDQTTQNDLKRDVGARLKASEEFRKIIEESRRCWTLQYRGSFHLDVLPAIPDEEGTANSILLSDRELRFWQHSNPIGYANWFFDRMRVLIDEQRSLLAKSAGLEIEDVPEWRVRTPLQRAVQVLKRHRDVYFSDDEDKKPVSIIITTLAAKAYKQDRDLEKALLSIVELMPTYIENRDGCWWVENPANPAENFADKWNEKPERRRAFFTWLRKVKQDLTAARLTESAKGVRETLSTCLGMREPLKIRTVGGASVPTLAGINHVVAPSWPERLQYKCRVLGAVYSMGRKRKLWPLTDRTVPKRFELRFETKTNVPDPYEVHWQVVNTGSEAARASGLRGDFYNSDSTKGVRWEKTEYCGTHWIEAFVVKDGVCLARSGRKYVRVGL